ncbi:transcription initiation protein SPT3 homolog isoform X2 [Lineus longissimus]|uniref:transcription initiation protein SPT3 homolog isoform X2 n=1 Tax=Lineus longissimus TaxID=88925 RepID=UPI00315DF315
METPVMQSPVAGGRNTTWFTSEIQQMMHGFGDCRKPLQESAAIIEKIVHQQLSTVLQQAIEANSVRNARFLGLEDFLFLLRRDKVKLRRFLRYMEVKDLKSQALKTMGDQEEQSEQGGEATKSSSSSYPRSRRRKICYDFLSSIDQTGELIALFDDDSVDEIKFQRSVRADIQARNMDEQKYKEFNEARQASFSRKYKSQRFREWLVAGINLEIKPNPLAMEVLSYLAYETVAQVVDLSLLVKKDSITKTDDPITRAMPHIYMSHDPFEFINQTKSKSQTASVKKEPLGGTSPTLSGSATSLEMSTLAIQPGEIREAMRTYGYLIGPFGAFSKPASMNMKQKILSL